MKRSNNLSPGFLTAVSGIFLASPLMAQVTVLHSFASGPAGGGYGPWASLTQLSGFLYGTAAGGGSSDGGTVFRIGEDGSGYSVMQAFSGLDGSWPSGSLIYDGTTLYSTTRFGGVNGGSGTIFRVSTNGTGFGLLRSLSPPDGALPFGALTRVGSNLYGMTNAGGGDSSSGSIFRIGTDGAGFSVLHRFARDLNDGGQATGSLTQIGSNLYGMTYRGGSIDGGTLFRIGIDGNGYTVLHHFAGGASDGYLPYGSLTQSGTTLYGMTGGGGNSGNGTIFQIGADGDGFSILHSFEGGPNDGKFPYGSLIQSGSTLYGMTRDGGAHDLGSIFQMQTDGTSFGLMHSFAGGPNDGSKPYGDLTLTANGVLYGMTGLGGANDRGAIFSIPVPEPSSMLLLATGFFVFVKRRGARRRISNSLEIRAH